MTKVNVLRELHPKLSWNTKTGSNHKNEDHCSIWEVPLFEILGFEKLSNWFTFGSLSEDVPQKGHRLC